MRSYTTLWRLAICGTVCVGAVLAGQAGDDAPRTYTRAQVRRMMKEAHTSAQYKALAQLFRNQQAAYTRQAEASRADYEKYRTSTRPKTPTAADNARSWQAYCSSKADRAGILATRYEGLLAASLRPQRDETRGSDAVNALAALDPETKATQDEIDRLELQVRTLREKLKKP